MGEYITNRVQQLRLGKEVTQEELAGVVGVSRQTISAIEKGHYTPSVHLAIKIATYFNRPVEDLFTITYER